MHPSDVTPDPVERSKGDHQYTNDANLDTSNLPLTKEKLINLLRMLIFKLIFSFSSHEHEVPRERLNMGCGECLAKFGLISFNVVFMLSGIAVMATGIFVKVNPDVVNMQHLVSFDSGDDALGKAAWVLIGFGVFVLIVSAFGFFTACCGDSKKVFVIIYIAFLVIIFIGEFAGGISAAVFKGKLDKELPDILSKTFESYKPDNSQLLTKAWDYVQTILKCCGSHNASDYRYINFTLSNQRVPMSCCKSSNKDPEHPNPDNQTKCFDESTQYDTSGPGGTYTNLLTDGCYDKLNSDIKSHLALIIGVGVGIGMLQLLGIVLACCVCRRDKDDDY